MLKTIGYLGPEGTYTQEAAVRFAAARDVPKNQLRPFATVHEVMRAVDRQRVSFGVVPIENSIEGTVNAVTDALASKKWRTLMTAELIVPVRHYLLARRSLQLTHIQEIVSHPQAIEQCENFLFRHCPKAIIHLTGSTADAADRVAQGAYSEKTAVIASEPAAHIYRLKILRKNIQDTRDNETRFVVLGKKKSPRTGRDKTSVVFTLPKDRPGGLHGILGEFARRKINLTKIESRPTKAGLGEYYFFLDCEGHRDDRLVKEALAALRSKVSSLKILGSYPRTH